MKRFNYKKTILPVVMGITLFTLPAFAGVNYIQYREDFQRQKEMKAPPSTEGKHLQRSNKYIREQQRDTTGVPSSSKGCDTNHVVSKYDRCYWNPAQ